MVLFSGQAPPIELTPTHRTERREGNGPDFDSGGKLESLQGITIKS